MPTITSTCSSTPFYGGLLLWPGRVRRSGESEPRDLSRGLVLVVGGVGGLDLCGLGLRYVTGAIGCLARWRSFDWGHGFGRWYADLTRRGQPRPPGAAARRGDPVGSGREQPDAPVFLVGKSGGAGIAVKALEQLDEGSVERAVLLAPALSPGYDLTRALWAVRREMVVFWSPLDVVDPGRRDPMFGTIDRVRTFGAGMLGFTLPGADEPRTRSGGASTRSSARSAGGRGWPDRLSRRSLRPGQPAVPPQVRRTAPSRRSAGGVALNRGSVSSRSPAPPIT